MTSPLDAPIEVFFCRSLLQPRFLSHVDSIILHTIPELEKGRARVFCTLQNLAVPVLYEARLLLCDVGTGTVRSKTVLPG
jgi:hypothetical protein